MNEDTKDNEVEEVTTGDTSTVINIFRTLCVNNVDLDNHYIDDNPNELIAAYLLSALGLLNGDVDLEIRVTWLKGMLDSISTLDHKNKHCH